MQRSPFSGILTSLFDEDCLNCSARFFAAGAIWSLGVDGACCVDSCWLLTWLSSFGDNEAETKLALKVDCVNELDNETEGETGSEGNVESWFASCGSKDDFGSAMDDDDT